MYLPKSPKAINVDREMVNAFGGYNHVLKPEDNQFYDTKNLTNDYYPVVAPREKRGLTGTTLTKPNGLFSADALAWVDGTEFFYDNTKVAEVEDSEKHFVQLGAYLIVLPDRLVYNLHTHEVTYIDASFIAGNSDTITFTVCDISGAALTYVAQSAEPSHSSYSYWIDTSAYPHVLRYWDASKESWEAEATTFVKIACTGIGADFKEGDGVTISGATDSTFNDKFVIQSIDDDYIVVTALIDAAATQTGSLKVERKMPDYDYMCSGNNRLWSCSADTHEVHACKLGDPYNWNVFQGIASDSYAATIGTEGDFTGCIAYASYILFFKEDCIHRLYGTVPSNYQITTQECRGVQSGSEHSLCIVNEILFYKSVTGICAYDTQPVDIASEFGTERYYEASAGRLGNKYYISMRTNLYDWHLFVYNMAIGTWMREDDTHAKWLTYARNGLYYIDAADGKLLIANASKVASALIPGMPGFYPGNVYPSMAMSGEVEDDFESSMEFGDIGIDKPYNKYISKINFRVQMDAGASLTVYVQYDSSGTWESIHTINATANKAITIPVLVRRCDHCRLKITGSGSYKVYSRSFVIEEGSEI